MMQTPDIGRMILERTGDAHEIELPFGEWLHLGPIHLPTGWIVNVGGKAIDLSPTRNVVFMAVAALLVGRRVRVSRRQSAEGRRGRQIKRQKSEIKN